MPPATPPRGPAREAPSSPTSPMAYKTTSRHLHHRTLSTSTRIPLLSGPPTTPPRRGANHLVSIPETPTTRRARKQLNRTQGKAKEWLEENLGRGFTMRRLVLLALVAIALLALAVDALTRGGRLGRFATSGLMTEAEQEMVVSAGNTVNGGASGAAPAARPLPSHKAPAPPPPPEPKLLPPPEIEQVQPPPPPPPAPVAVEEEPQRAPPPARLPLDEDSPRPAPVLEKPAPPKQQKPTIVKVPGPPPPVEVVAEKKEEAVAPPSQKFILTAWMGEQEGKAQFHLYQLGLLAMALNRTLVLPTVKRSRFGNCFSHPFSLYYEEDSLARFGIPYITSADFFDWTRRPNSPVPSAQLVALARGAPMPEDRAFMPIDHFCLHHARLDLGDRSPRAFFSPLNDHMSEEIRTDFADQVVESLLSEDDQADVLVVQYNLRYSLLTPSLSSTFPTSIPAPAPYSYFEYSHHWTELGHQLAATLSPYIAVHWRTETIPTNSLAPCGSALVHRLVEMKRAHPELSLVYLATDYPIEVLQLTGKGSDGAAHSATMNKELTPQHHIAMASFLRDFEEAFGEKRPEAERMRLTSFVAEQDSLVLDESLLNMLGGGAVEPEQQRRRSRSRVVAKEKLPKLSELDGAIVGIVDKIVLMKAELFLAGSVVSSKRARQCAKKSTFTMQVIEGRQDIWADTPRDEGAALVAGTLWNDVSHWSINNRGDD